jgi:hypothetical protein
VKPKHIVRANERLQSILRVRASHNVQPVGIVRPSIQKQRSKGLQVKMVDSTAVGKLPSSQLYLEAFLLDRKVVGDQYSRSRCPIANYLASELRIAPRERVWVGWSTVCIVRRRPFLPAKTIALVNLTLGHRVFIRNFDGGFYPSLIATSRTAYHESHSN